MKKLFPLFFFIVALGMLFPSCYYDKEETLYPFQKCDTTHVTYSQTIVPILSANCYVCHTAGDPRTTTKLDTYDGIYAVATNGKLVPAVDQTGPLPMPNNGSKLDECSIQKIKRWVANGAKSN
jgi:mono/diheme cytochrome c family protein